MLPTCLAEISPTFLLPFTYWPSLPPCKLQHFLGRHSRWDRYRTLPCTAPYRCRTEGPSAMQLIPLPATDLNRYRLGRELFPAPVRQEELLNNKPACAAGFIRDTCCQLPTLHACYHLSPHLAKHTGYVTFTCASHRSKLFYKARACLRLHTAPPMRLLADTSYPVTTATRRPTAPLQQLRAKAPARWRANTLRYLSPFRTATPPCLLPPTYERATYLLLADRFTTICSFAAIRD